MYCVPHSLRKWAEQQAGMGSWLPAPKPGCNRWWPTCRLSLNSTSSDPPCRILHSQGWCATVDRQPVEAIAGRRPSLPSHVLVCEASQLPAHPAPQPSPPARVAAQHCIRHRFKQRRRHRLRQAGPRQAAAGAQVARPWDQHKLAAGLHR